MYLSIYMYVCIHIYIYIERYRVNPRFECRITFTDGVYTKGTRTYAQGTDPRVALGA